MKNLKKVIPEKQVAEKRVEKRKPRVKERKLHQDSLSKGFLDCSPNSTVLSAGALVPGNGDQAPPQASSISSGGLDC